MHGYEFWLSVWVDGLSGNGDGLSVLRLIEPMFNVLSLIKFYFEGEVHHACEGYFQGCVGDMIG